MRHKFDDVEREMRGLFVPSGTCLILKWDDLDGVVGDNLYLCYDHKHPPHS